MSEVVTKIDNEQYSFSEAGMVLLKHHEGVRSTYYNDPANCTYGVGTLVHLGPCTPEEIYQTVTPEQIEASLQSALTDAQKTVKRKVRNRQLSQPQFDALVSYVYNRGAPRAGSVLKMIDEGKFSKATQEMSRAIYVRVKDKKTGKLQTQLLPGLVLRRADETRPFKDEKK